VCGLLCVCVFRLIDAIDDMKRVIMDSAQFLLTPDKSHYSYSDAGSIFDVVCVSKHNLCFDSYFRVNLASRFPIGFLPPCFPEEDVWG